MDEYEEDPLSSDMTQKNVANLLRGMVTSPLGEIVIDALRLLPAAIVVFVSSVPSQSLAFAEHIQLSQEPLVFIRDPDLANTAIVGIDLQKRYGTAGQLLSSRASRIATASPNIYPGLAVRVLATAYSSTRDQTDGNPNITASGAHVGPGTMAANFLPFGTRVRIGSAMYTVQDRMNARYDGKYIIDVWQESREAAISFGVRVVEIEVVSLP